MTKTHDPAMAPSAAAPENAQPVSTDMAAAREAAPDEPTTTMHQDGMTMQIAASDVESHKRAGWTLEPLAPADPAAAERERAGETTDDLNRRPPP